MNKQIKLYEYEPIFLDTKDYPEYIGEFIWNNFKEKIDIEFPTIKTINRLKLTSLGWVGYIPIDRELWISLLPKVPINNIFKMLEYAYRLESFYLLKDIIECNTIQDFFERLANILALRIIDRGRKGFYKEYKEKTEKLSYIAGRLDIKKMLMKPWDTKPGINQCLDKT
jgi:5-methylcytosine-specific restriction enzyme subunit McrC